MKEEINHKKFHLLTYICALITGILFIVFHNDSNIITGLTIIAALMFLVPGAINLLTSIFNSRKKNSDTGLSIGLLLVSAGAIGLGILMLAMPPFFADYVAFTLGVLLVICAIYQFVWVLKGSATTSQKWFAAVSVLVAAAGVVLMIVKSDGFTASLWLATGIVLIAYALNGFIAVKVLSSNKKDDTVVFK